MRSVSLEERIRLRVAAREGHELRKRKIGIGDRLVSTARAQLQTTRSRVGKLVQLA
jgi:hypothetical protein